MDAKHISEDVPPPPYSIHGDDMYASRGVQPYSATYHLERHLASLPDRVRSNQQTREVQQTLDDSSLLDYITPIIEGFLAELGDRPTAPPLATLTLVPETAVPQKATLSGSEEMRGRGEVCRVARVDFSSDSKDSKSASSCAYPHEQSGGVEWSPGREFSDWGRFGDSSSSACDTGSSSSLLWWCDEAMAHRLASYLQPKIEKSEPEELRSPVQEAVEQRLPAQKEKKGWGWGRRKADRDSDNPARQLEESSGTAHFVARPARPVVRKHSRAEMVVAGQEVAFRHENDFGILESVNGWAIVVSVTIRAQ